MRRKDIKSQVASRFSYSSRLLVCHKPQTSKHTTTMAKLIFALAVILAVVAFASAQGGVKDILGNYYDFTSGQVSSSLTGRVYNTVPAAVPVHSYVASYAAPYLASPYIASPYVAAPAVYSSPLLLK